MRSFNTVTAITALLLGAACTVLPAQTPSPTPSTKFLTWAPTPPMGWNSWDCYGDAVSEAQTRANIDYMADKLAKHGWKYIVVDIQWYEPLANGFNYRPNAKLVTDDNGRLLPAPNRFPSAADGKGFKSLADYVHSKGLKFGIHLLRGIPRQCVDQNTPILGTSYHAADIADKVNVCRWNGDMYGVDMSKPGAQEYYNSVFKQIAAWGVDFVKVDDLAGHTAEIAAIRTAIDASGRPIVFSISPGGTSVDAADFIDTHANMWRISFDFWDNWRALKSQFDRCNNWSKITAPGHFPDADMLPLGAIRAAAHDPTHFTRDEQYTMMTLWSIFRSPLMMGGDMPENDDFTLSLLTNDQVLAVNQHSTNGHQLFRNGDQIAWVADVPGSKSKYLAVFNAADKPADATDTTAPVSVSLADLGFTGACKVQDLWANKAVGPATGTFAPAIDYHGAGLYRVDPTN
jgi:alpha-galactosidase